MLRSRPSLCEGAQLTHYHLAALILAVVGPLLALAKRLRIPESMMLFAAGLASTVVPGLPTTAIDADMVMTLFLPPLLYASTVRVSWHLLRFTLLPGAVLGSMMVIVTIVAVAASTRSLFLPGLSWPAALLIGIVAAFFDTRLFHEAKGRPRVPRAIADTLKARELAGRIIILGTLAFVEDRLAGEGNVARHLAENYLLAIPAGVAAGVAVGQAAVWLRRRIEVAPIEIAVSIATPYVAALIAEAFGISGAAAIITSALVVSAIRVDRETGATISSSEARISATAFWEEASLIVSSVVFLLAGRAVPDALEGLGQWPVWQVLGATAGILVVALCVQFAFSLAATRLSPIRSALAERQSGSTSQLAAAAVMTWSSTRSVIALVIALSVPAVTVDGSTFAERDLILAVGALVVIGSILVQGISLPFVVRRAGLADPADDAEEEEKAAQAMREAAQAPGPQHGSAVNAARQQLVRLREQDEIGDEVLTGMLREADLVDRAGEKDALPGAGPPQP